jgi:hypothetical protein
MRTPVAPARVLATCLSLAAAVVLAAPGDTRAQPGPPPGLSVRVVNTPAEPVPVTTNAPVEVIASAPLPVALSAPVSIDTTTPLPVSIVGPGAPQPIQISLFQPSTNPPLPDNNKYRVPDGKRLVIEYVSCFGLDADDFIVALFVKTRLDGLDSFHLCPFEVRVNSGRPGTGMSYAGAQPMRAYADPGTDVVIGFSQSPAAAFPVFSAVLSGYLIDVP